MHGPSADSAAGPPEKPRPLQRPRLTAPVACGRLSNVIGETCLNQERDKIAPVKINRRGTKKTRRQGEKHGWERKRPSAPRLPRCVTAGGGAGRRTARLRVAPSPNLTECSLDRPGGSRNAPQENAKWREAARPRWAQGWASSGRMLYLSCLRQGLRLPRFRSCRRRGRARAPGRSSTVPPSNKVSSFFETHVTH